MTPVQMLDYIHSQCMSVHDTLDVAIHRGDTALEARKRTELRVHIEFLRGYMTSMEHAGLIEKTVADIFFSTIDRNRKLFELC
jgi:hypothetical protein